MRNYVLTAVCALLMLVGCSNHWHGIAYGYRAIRVTKKVAEKFDKGLKVYLDRTRDQCLQKHKPKTPELAKCVQKPLEISWIWTGEKMGKKTGQGVLPNLQKGQAAAKESLDAAFDYLETKNGKCSGKECDKTKAWMKLLKPGFCASFRLFDVAMNVGAVKFITSSSSYSLAKNLHAVLCK